MNLDLFYYSNLASQKRVLPKEQLKLLSMPFDPKEMVQLKLMNTEQLDGLMAFCQIRVFNDVPITACTDDEKRLAFCVFRSAGTGKKEKKLIDFFKKEASYV
jgi:hypothetical protein